MLGNLTFLTTTFGKIRVILGFACEKYLKSLSYDVV